MRIAGFAVALTAWLTTPAAATCLVAVPNLSFEQWYPYCAAEIAQMCNAPKLRNVPNCKEAIAKAEYENYHPNPLPATSCGPQNAGQSRCVGGWMARCDGTLWQRTAKHC